MIFQEYPKLIITSIARNVGIISCNVPNVENYFTWEPKDLYNLSIKYVALARKRLYILNTKTLKM